MLLICQAIRPSKHLRLAPSSTLRMLGSVIIHHLSLVGGCPPIYQEQVQCLGENNNETTRLSTVSIGGAPESSCALICSVLPIPPAPFSGSSLANQCPLWSSLQEFSPSVQVQAGNSKFSPGLQLNREGPPVSRGKNQQSKHKTHFEKNQNSENGPIYLRVSFWTYNFAKMSSSHHLG